MNSTFKRQRPAPFHQSSTPFFHPAQTLAFKSAPPTQAIKGRKIAGNKTSPYLPGLYTTCALNEYIGVGYWENDHEIVDIVVDECRTSKWENQTQVWKDSLMVSATIRTVLTIHSHDDSGRTRRYTALTTGKAFCDPQAGTGDARDAAVKGAETKGMVRAAARLGRVFGLNLKNDLEENAFPVPINVFDQRFQSYLDQQEAARAQSQEPAEALPKPELRIIENKNAEPESAPASPELAASQQRILNAMDDMIAAGEGVEIDDEDQDPDAEDDAEDDTQTEEAFAPHDARQPEPEASPSPATPAAPPSNVVSIATPNSEGSINTDMQTVPADWDLTMIPPKGDYMAWLRALATMRERINSLQNQAEIEGILRNYKRIIQAWPVIPGTSNFKERNFKAAFVWMMMSRCRHLGITPPEGYDQESLNRHLAAA